MDALVPLVAIVCLVMLISAIYHSQKRWLSFGYAVLGFVIPLVLGFILTFILVPSSGTVADTNSVLDTIGMAINFASPICAVLGATIPPKRAKKT
ncbi:MAG: hypothetical protein ABSH19_03480 [Opitutales bacterium]|jgi:L-cystine uptake protein TcyP (sodium:dicarboxylate symporter family)